MAFAIDGSGSIRGEYFTTVQNFVINIIKQLEVSSNKVRLAAVNFEGQARVEFTLNRYNNSHDIMQTIKQMKHRGGRTSITSALDRIKNAVSTNILCSIYCPQ